MNLHEIDYHNGESDTVISAGSSGIIPTGGAVEFEVSPGLWLVIDVSEWGSWQLEQRPTGPSDQRSARPPIPTP